MTKNATVNKQREVIISDPVTVTGLSHEGRGVAQTQEGKTVFIDGVLLQEQVKFTTIKRRSRFDEAKVHEVISASPDRVTPLCPHADVCGGCSLQHMNNDAQVTHKQEMVLEQLRHFGGVVPESIAPACVGPLWGYRRKARLGVKFVPKKGGILLGFREKQGHLLADLSACAVLAPIIGERFALIKALIGQLSIYTAIPQLEIAVGDNAAALVFRHLAPFTDTDKEILKTFAVTHQIHIYLQPGGLASTHRLWPTAGPERLTYDLPDFDLTLSFHPQDFVQVNGVVNRQLVRQAVEWLDVQKTDRVLDLFCGLGNFSLPLARRAKSVVGVEGAQMMVERATENASHNGIDNTAFFASDLSVLDESLPFAQQTYDKVLIDPPRSGAQALLPLLGRWAAQKIVYVSCNPATLARDAGILCQTYGYRLVRLGVVDLFPHTTHIESIALLEKIA
ncbi:MAG: rRNA ((1939)-C(5))-methyltransferase RlmD [Pseudomonadota bacterium]|jgi:23S rRNA (uracil1939-C5)-methyltransferase